MRLPDPSPTRSWLLLAAYVALVYASLPFVRDVVVALRQQQLLGAVVTGVYFLAAVALVYHVVFDVRLSDRIAFIALVILAALAGSLVLGLAIPEERIHFVQYGLMALLARGACAWTMKPRGAFIAALALASAAGYVDELIQGLLPDRVYDLRDVAINAVAALLALVVDEVLHHRIGWLPAEETR